MEPSLSRATVRSCCGGCFWIVWDFAAAMATMATLLLQPLSRACFVSRPQDSTPGKAVPVRSFGKLAAASPRISRVSSRSNSVVRASVNGGEDGVGSAASAGGDSIVSEVALLQEEPDTEGVASVAGRTRKPSPLQRGGTLDGEQAEGKAPSAATLGKSKPLVTSGDKFSDPRWIKGTWDLTKFTKDAKVDWDAVINAEVLRRKWLEENPEASSNSEPVLFETSTVPWWAWVKRFHLPEAELLNGRAAMVGYFSAYLVDAATGVGLVDQSNSFFGKLLLFVTVCGVLLIRKNSDIANLRNLANESTFYDKQWQATWKDSKDTEKSEEQ